MLDQLRTLAEVLGGEEAEAILWATREIEYFRAVEAYEAACSDYERLRRIAPSFGSGLPALELHAAINAVERGCEAVKQAQSRRGYRVFQTVTSHVAPNSD